MPDNDYIKRIVVLGPESSGKTTLCESLAKHFQTNWVPEYARTYLQQKRIPYQYEDLEIIAREQLRMENRITLPTLVANQPYPVFLDTNLEVIKVWSQEVYGKCSHVILNALAESHYDYYLLCKPDLEWAPDSLRENPEPENRLRHYHLFLDALAHAKTPFSIIEGKGEERIKTGLDAVKKWMKGNIV